MESPDIPPSPAAVEARALRAGWTKEERAYRSSRAKVTRHLVKHWKKVYPGHWRICLNCLSDNLRQVWIDCSRLDSALVKAEKEPGYKELFATFHDSEAVMAIDYVCYLELLQISGGKAPRFVEMRNAAGMNKWRLHRLRELLKDGWTVDQALDILPLPDHEERGAAYAQYLKDQADVLDDFRRKPEKFLRSYSDWIVRLWLTLRFYKCEPNGNEACARAWFAGNLMEMGMPSDKLKFDRQFLTAWRNVRNRVFGKSNPLLSQFAGAE